MRRPRPPRKLRRKPVVPPANPLLGIEEEPPVRWTPNPPAHPLLDLAIWRSQSPDAERSFQAFAVRETAAAILTGIVLGDGPPAARLAERLVQSLSEVDPVEEPEQVMVRLDQCARGFPEEALAVAAAFVLLDVELESLLLYNAGHPPPLMFVGDRVGYYLAMAGALGLRNALEGGPAMMAFKAYDTLLLYTGPDLTATPSEEMPFTQHVATLRDCADAHSSDLLRQCLEAAACCSEPDAEVPTFIAVRRRPA